MLNRRIALLLKDRHGNIETWDLFSRRRLVGASLSIVIWGGLLGLAAIAFGWHLPFSQVTPGPGLKTAAKGRWPGPARDATPAWGQSGPGGTTSRA